MKKIITKSVLLALLTVYTIFSTGIFISIHHCCLHCNEKVEMVSCGCSGQASDHVACISKDKHHHCHDDRFFFKILDSYDKKEGFLSVFHYIQQICFCHDCCKNRILHDSIFLHIACKEFDESPPFFIKQGRTFAEFHHQRVLYA